jgi:hypothetical protein
MAKINRFEEIEAFQTARDLTKLVYRWSNEGAIALALDYGLQGWIGEHRPKSSVTVRRLPDFGTF